MKTETIIRMSYNDIEQIFKEWYGINFEPVPEFEWNNDSCYSTEVGPDDTLNDYDQREWDAMITVKRVPSYPGFHQVMQGLYQEGLIPAGRYVVEVSW